MPAPPKQVAIIGGGPAGLFAAEYLSAAGFGVTVYDRKPSIGRKFLMAGRGGLNLTHSEDIEKFIARYGAAADWLAPSIHAFTPAMLREWSDLLGEETFVGSSGRVFPKSFKASPLLRAWQARLVRQGVTFNLSREWRGWENGALVFENAHGTREQAKPDAVLLALGGASWPRLGSDGGWVNILRAEKIDIAELAPANCGFTVAWSEIFRARHAGQPLKSAVLSLNGIPAPGEAMLTERGIEGGAVYALSSRLRDEVAKNGHAVLTLDMKPGMTAETLADKLAAPRRGQSFANTLRKEAGLGPAAIGVLNENRDAKNLSPTELATLIKHYPLTIGAPFPIDRAISSAGGVTRAAVDDHFMLAAKPGVFVAGEMLDWEAPTGGYLLQACFATGRRAAAGIESWLRKAPAEA